ncbi:hypothetical protein G3I40_39200 [Streptomyces sp. SID14478]|uniref:hypothetical protein n=1 Tax=Streptomyces sp. SID14478 TaxID=2706073 RepID=UPI0013DE95CC|nr:hypothetical protein [Streptomyces sp. SID14478]NEB81193.1 hypothetical protein [Streptomyces sp. SID14478]
MTYDFLAVEPLSNEAVAEGLARCFGLSVEDVDVADEHTDQDLRNWDAPILCEKTTVRGDVTASLDIYAQESVQSQPGEPDLAAAFACAVQGVVLYPAEEILPSAYWLAADDGTVTRVRLLVTDDEDFSYAIDAVEAPVARLPQAAVTRLPEIVREQRKPTPFADRFGDLLSTLGTGNGDVPGALLWRARDCLGAWEELVRTMGDGWGPAGWYPAELYLERLEARDELEAVQQQLTPQAVELLKPAVEPLDERFEELTVQDDAWVAELTQSAKAGLTTSEGQGLWWQRRPDPLPW